MTEQIEKLVNNGEKCIREGDLDKGISLLSDALALYESEAVSNADILSVIYSQLGNAYYMRKDFVKSRDFHAKDTEISSKSTPIQKAKALSNYSMALAMNGQFEEALNVARQVICEAHNMDPNEAQSFNCRGYYNLGMAFMQFYNFNKNGNEFDATCFDHLNEAKNAFKKCLEFSVNKFDENQQIEVDPVGTLFYNLAVGNLALVYYFSQEYEDARHYYEKRLKTAINSGDYAAQLRTLINLGNTSLQLAKPIEALKYYYNALEIHQSKPDRDIATEARLYFNVANTEFVLKNYVKAIENFAEACRLSKQIDDTTAVSESFYQIAGLLEQIQMVPEALYYLIQRYNLERERASLAVHQLYDSFNQVDKDQEYQRNSSNLNQAMDTAKADIERFVRKYPTKCVTADGKVNARPIADLNRSHVSLMNTSLSLDAQNDENRPINTTHNTSSSFDLMNSSAEGFILGVAASANSSSSATNRTSSRRSQRYEISSSTTNDEDDFSFADVGFSRTSHYTPAKLAISAIDNASMPSSPFSGEKTPGPSNKADDDEEAFLDFYQRASSRRIDSQRGELREEPDDFIQPSDVFTSTNSKKQKKSHLRHGLKTLSNALKSGKKSVGGSLHRQLSSTSKLSGSTKSSNSKLNL